MDINTSREQVLHETINDTLIDAPAIEEGNQYDKPKMTIETSKFKKKQSPKRSFYVQKKSHVVLQSMDARDMAQGDEDVYQL